MRTREAIVTLLDEHTETLGLTRRQVASLTGVNAGQLSNWLRTSGPLSVVKEGKVADVMLRQAEAVLQQTPPPMGAARIGDLAKILRRDGPRRRLGGLEPTAAEQGTPIVRDNPLYIERPCDEELLNLMRSVGDRVLMVVGGPKTGKSSLLLRAQEAMERSAMPVFIDFKDYMSLRPPSARQEDARATFFDWLSHACQEQTSGGSRATWEQTEDIVPWLRQQILPAAKSDRTYLIFDHLDRLGEHNHDMVATGQYPEGSQHWEHDALSNSIRYLVDRRNEDAPELKSVGFALAIDPNSRGLPPFARSSVLGGNSTILVPESGRSLQFGASETCRLLEAAGVAISAQERSELLRATGGHVFLTQTYVTTRKTYDHQAALEAVKFQAL